jgi:hypothetical protein
MPIPGLPSVAEAISGAASGLAGAVNGAAGGLASALRSVNIPLNAEAFTPKADTKPQQGAGGDAADWRVRLSFPNDVAEFAGSPVFTPLKEAGGLIFPYTPTISINSTANYTESPVTHQNYQFVSYANSRVSEISVSGDFYVEDAVQARYWLSCVHFLRSVTKMFVGPDQRAGNPPILLYFNAYGDFVFRDVPVVVKSFSMTLPKEVDYIRTNINGIGTSVGNFGGGDPTGSIGGLANTMAGIASAAGATQAAAAMKSVANIANVLSGGGKSPNSNASSGSANINTENDSHVPTQSTLNMTLLPIYSRTRVRKFSLETFVNGGYVKDGFI